MWRNSTISVTIKFTVKNRVSPFPIPVLLSNNLKKQSYGYNKSLDRRRMHRMRNM